VSHPRLGVIPSGYFMYISTPSFPFRYRSLYVCLADLEVVGS